MGEGSLSVSSAIEPLAGGIIGLGVGYSLAPKKYSLRGLIKLDKDTFEKIYTKDLQENLSKEDKEALEIILGARKDYHISQCSIADEIRQKVKDWNAKYDKIEVPEILSQEREQQKNVLKKLAKDLNYESLNRNYIKASEAFKLNPGNSILKTQLYEASAKLAEAKVALSGTIAAYRSAVLNILAAKNLKIKEDPTKYIDVIDSFNELQSAYAKRQTIASNKLFELTNNRTIRKSYEALKSFIPKTRTKSAIWGAVIAGLVSAIAVYILDKSVDKMK